MVPGSSPATVVLSFFSRLNPLFTAVPKGNQFSPLPTDAQLIAVESAAKATEVALGFLPHIGPDVITTATITPERLPLADACLKAADLAPSVTRKAFDRDRFAGRIGAYRRLFGIYTVVARLLTTIERALNALGADILFDCNNIHEDIEKDNNETADLGPLRQDINNYYRRPGAGKNGQGKGGAGTPPPTPPAA